MPFIAFLFAVFLFIYAELSLLVWLGSTFGYYDTDSVANRLLLTGYCHSFALAVGTASPALNNS